LYKDIVLKTYRKSRVLCTGEKIVGNFEIHYTTKGYDFIHGNDYEGKSIYREKFTDKIFFTHFLQGIYQRIILAEILIYVNSLLQLLKHHDWMITCFCINC
uniref:Glycosyltransferase family 2 protein n=1 Tax=Strongyloides venezuelensis TaxID=75913 RepID=A0A0K0FLT4_STRVS